MMHDLLNKKAYLHISFHMQSKRDLCANHTIISFVENRTAGEGSVLGKGSFVSRQDPTPGPFLRCK